MRIVILRTPGLKKKKKKACKGTWLTQSENPVTCDLRDMSLSLMLGAEITKENKL